MTPKSQPLDQNRCSESGSAPIRKTASGQSARNTECAQVQKMTEFLNAALLVRMNYKDWQELVRTVVEYPKTEEYGSLVFIENKSELVFGLWLSAYCGVFNLDPSYPFTCQSGPVPLEQKTISLGDPLDESFSLEVGYMWIRLGEPDCRVNKDSIRERIRLAELQIEPSTRLRAEVTTAKILSGIYRRWSVPITVRRLDGSTLNYQVFLDRSVEVIELETNGEKVYLRIIEDLFPHCLQPIVKRSRERSNTWADQVRRLESNVRDAERFVKSNMIHPAIWDPYKYGDNHIAGSAANRIIPVVSSNIDNSTTSTASKTDNDINSVTNSTLQPSSEPQSNTNGRRRKVIAEPEDATKLQLISDLKQLGSNEVARAPRQSGRTRASKGKAVGHEPQSDNVADSALLAQGSRARASEGEAVRHELLSDNGTSLTMRPPREPQSNITKGRRGKRYYKLLPHRRPKDYSKLRENRGTAKGQATGDRKQTQLIEPQGDRAQASEGEDVGSESRRWLWSSRLSSSGPLNGII